MESPTSFIISLNLNETAPVTKAARKDAGETESIIVRSSVRSLALRNVTMEDAMDQDPEIAVICTVLEDVLDPPRVIA